MSKWHKEEAEAKKDETFSTLEEVKEKYAEAKETAKKEDVKLESMEDILAYWTDDKNQKAIDEICHKFGLNKNVCSIATKRAMVGLIK